MKSLRVKVWASSLLAVLMVAVLFSPEIARAMGMGGGGPVVADDIVITPGPMKSPMRIAPSGSSRYLVSDYMAGVIYEIDPAAPDQPVALFKVQGHPLALEVDPAAVGQDEINNEAELRRIYATLSGVEREIVRQALFRHRSLPEVAKRTRQSLVKVTRIVNNILKSIEQSSGPVELVFVGNDTAGTIEVYRKNGAKVMTFTSAGQFQPSDMAYDAVKKKLFVADSLANEVKVFSPGGLLLGAFGATAPLSDPQGIAIDAAAQQVFVSDYGDPRVGIPPSLNIFDYQGKLIHRLTENLSRPQGLALDAGNLYVADAMLGQILVFDRATFANTGALGSFGVADGELLLPMDLTRDSATGKLYVTNNRVGRVSAFAPPAP